MIPTNIIQKIRHIQITTSRIVTDLFAGQYESVFKGRGMEFDEVREYAPGDEIRSIDWNVTARTGNPYVKKFVEERQLTVMVLLDASGSCNFGSAKRLKSELAAELSAVLAFCTLQNNDRVGLIVFTDKVEKFVPPNKGMRHVLRVIREALYFKPKGKKTDIHGALEYLNRVVKHRAVVFIVSDFFAEGFKRPLAAANNRHDVIAVTITDPRERELPAAGIVEIADAETLQKRGIDTSSRKLRSRYAENARRLLEGRTRLFQSIGVDHIDIQTNEPYVKPLIKFFKMRRRRI
ncbi:MAG: DUF58 domain-containing protein [Candidatus Omnitrophota bacterium]